MKLPEALFHYTVGPKLPLIARSGRLLPTAIMAGPREKPVLWWSANVHWEPTATKLVAGADGRVQAPSFDELSRQFGAFRFRLDTRHPDALLKVGIKLLPWPRVQTAARIDTDEVTRMVASGVRHGAKPMDWWGCLEAVPVSLEVGGLLRVEELRDGQWQACEGGLGQIAASIDGASNSVSAPS